MNARSLRLARASIAVGLLVAAAMLPAVVLVMQIGEILAVFSAPPDPVSYLDRTLAAAAGRLRGRAAAGYLAPPSHAVKEDATVRRRFLAQYALAPTVLIEDVDQPVLIADCADPLVCADLLRATELEVERDLGAGFLLLRKPSPKSGRSG